MRQRRRWGRWRLLAAAAGCGITAMALAAEGAVDQRGADGAPPPVEIKKIYFMFHPVCWAIALRNGKPPPGYDPKNYLDDLAWEKEVNQRQKNFMSRMKPDEALVLFPISRQPPMLELEEHATRTLGRRCIIVRRNAVASPPEWANLKNPIERFLDDDNLEGKAKWLEGVPPKIQSELAAEIREACRTLGSGWNLGVLKVIYYSRLAAMDLQREFRERGLRYDPATVESEAFGEGFEQCATTWKAMLVPYMGLKKPVENNFDLSVSGAPFLYKARFKEQAKLGKEVRLFLWEGADGRPIALFFRVWCRLKDPQFYARVRLDERLDGHSLEVWDLQNKRWPADDTPLKVEGGRLVVPVLNGIRRDATDGYFYLIGNSIPFDEFRRRLLQAPLTKRR